MQAGEPPAPEWDRVREIFVETLERSLPERGPFLDTACGLDATLRTEVESLLAAHDDADTFLEVSGVEIMAPWIVEEPGPSFERGVPNLRIGPYSLGREVGRGGMGTVYLAQRADERYQRRVAIKLVHTFAAGSMVRRFRKEQRILASLEHPSIARLYDAGAVEDGRPYIVMEYVEGSAIDSYCDEHGLSVEERLRLFDQVCAAVEFAHGRLVVHRDLKPSNILVTDEGVPKLLDFGIARLLHAGETEDPNPTTIGFRALTPEYASPEQLRGDPVSTSSDIWALGILLYRLLTGRHAYEFRSRSPLEVERTILAESPPRPSEVVAKNVKGGSALARRLHGDIDTIILTALRREPARRYGTVAELRADIRAHLRGFPVSASPDSWRYRAGKFLHRNRLGVSAAVLLAATVLVGSAGMAWQWRAATRESARARITRDYLVGMFESLDPDAAQGPTVRAEQILDQGARRLDMDLSAEPDLHSEVAGVLGELYGRLGLFEKARPLLEAANADLLGRYGERHPASVASTSRLARLMHAQGELREAEPLARAALAANRRLYGPADSEVAGSLADLGGILRSLGSYEEAGQLLREALVINQEAGDREAEAGGLGSLGLVHSGLGDYEEARQLFHESLEIRRDLYGDRDTRIATGLLNYASILEDAGDYDAAIVALEEGLAIRRELLGADHPDVAIVLNELANTHQSRGDLDSARPLHLEALRIRRAVFGEVHPQVANSLNNLGVVEYFSTDYAAAADLFEEVLQIWRMQLGEEHPDVLTALNNLGAARREAGQLEAAESVLRRALDLRRQTLAEGHPEVAQSQNNLAELLSARGMYAEAEEGYHTAIAGWRASLGDDHPNLAFGLYGLGRLLYATDRCSEAEEPLAEALLIREATLDSGSTDIAVVRYYLGLCRVEQGRHREASVLLEAAVEPMVDQWGEDHEFVQGARDALRRAASGGEPAA